jgi:hypothetical protein
VCTSPISLQTGIVPCGQCAECRQKNTREMSIRMVHESTMHKYNTFLTLTYDENNIPLNEDGQATLRKEHLRKFIKDLRNKKAYEGKRFRYYAVGEYGLKGLRAKVYGRNPHYHLIIFGLELLGDVRQSSKEVEELWQYGYNYVGGVSWDSASYCAKYVQKKLTGHLKSIYTDGKYEPEFALISKGSNSKKDIGTVWEKGIGYSYYKKYIEPNMIPEDPTIALHVKFLTTSNPSPISDKPICAFAGLFNILCFLPIFIYCYFKHLYVFSFLIYFI